MSNIRKIGEPCEVCKKPLVWVPKFQEADCISCLVLIQTVIANRNTFGHLWKALVELFNFRFISMIGSLIWAVERLFNIGDFNPKTGSFYIEGYIKRQ